MREGIRMREGVRLFIWLLLIGVMSTVPMSCKRAETTFTVGILNFPPDFEPVVEGFKAGMTELGYSEGTIHYVYNGPVKADAEAIDAEITRLLSRNIDLLFTTGNEVTLRAKAALEGTGIPIVFGCSMMVLEQGIVSNRTHPEGRITGIETSTSIRKAMEFIKIILPDIQKIYIPYNPKDTLSTLALSQLPGDRIWNNIEIITQEVTTAEEAIAAIENLPENIGAVFRIPSPMLDPRNHELSQIAIKRGLPVVSAMSMDNTVLLSFGSAYQQMGKQAARLAHQIRLGVSPSDLPIEKGEVFVTVNLQTAQKIGVNIPDVVIAQAEKIIY